MPRRSFNIPRTFFYAALAVVDPIGDRVREEMDGPGRSHVIGELVGTYPIVVERQTYEPRRWFGSMRRLSLARAIQGSNTIEGFEATLDDAAAVALGEELLDAGEETRLALAGYRNAMTYVLQLVDEKDFDYSTRFSRVFIS